MRRGFQRLLNLIANRKVTVQATPLRLMYVVCLIQRPSSTITTCCRLSWVVITNIRLPIMKVPSKGLSQVIRVQTARQLFTMVCLVFVSRIWLKRKIFLTAKVVRLMATLRAMSRVLQRQVVAKTTRIVKVVRVVQALVKPLRNIRSISTITGH